MTKKFVIIFLVLIIAAFLKPKGVLAGFAVGDPPLSSGLISYWKLDDGSVGQTGITAVDFLGNYNGAASGTTVVTGKINNARSFTSRSDYILSSSSYPQTAAISVAFWAKKNSTGQMDVITRRNAVGYSFWTWGIRFNSDGNIGFFTDGAGDDDVSTSGVNLNNLQWHHIAVTYTPGAKRIYVDGAQVYSNGWSSALYYGGNFPVAINVGSNQPPNNTTTNGLVDEVGIWNRALSATEVSNLYNGGNGNPICTGNVTITGSFSNAPNNTIKACTQNNTYCSGLSQPTGGTITYSGGYTIHTFTGSGTFTPPANGNIDVLVVAGGGGGGATGYNGSGGGGGGAGGYCYQTGRSVSAGTGYTVTIGSGGSGGASGAYNNGSVGSNSVFGTITANGGGAGHAYNTQGGAGGSGGGNGPYAGASGGTSNQSNSGGATCSGNNGGSATTAGSGYYQAGGGGGAFGAGGNATNAVAGNGGNGITTSINGSIYAGGGGGGSFQGYGAGSGGSGGGGAGVTNGSGANGTANTGGGGGGAGSNLSAGAGGAGGSGIVIIRYLTSSFVPGTYSISVPTNASYVITGDPAAGYTVSYSPGQNVSVACGNVAGPTIAYSNCIPTTCAAEGKTCGTIPDGCGGTLPCGGVCPLTPNAAGVVQSAGTINPGPLGNISQAGYYPGFRLTSYTSSVNTTSVSYTNLLNTILKNSGFNTTGALDANINCSGGGVVSTPSFNIYCYVASIAGNNFDAKLITAVGNTSGKTAILYPINNAIGSQTVTTVENVTNNKRVIVFVNGNLTVNNNISIPSANTGSGVVFVINGNLTTNPTVVNLDGVYIFSGGFDDGSSQTAINGNGSLLSTGTGNFFFNRLLAGNATPAEHWTYEPKYLVLFENSLATAKYTWQELPPQ